MPRSDQVSKRSKQLAEKFRQKTQEASRLRYGTMRKVDFSGWEDVGRFAKYAQAHLAVAEAARQKLGYWENLYELFTRGQISPAAAKGLTTGQQHELTDLQRQIRGLTTSEQTSLAHQIQFQHRETLNLLQKMSSEGLLTFDRQQTEKAGFAQPTLWAIARNAQGQPQISGGQLRLYPTKAPSPGRILREALDGAAKFRSDTGAPGKLGYFLGYASRATLNHLQQRPFFNSLTAQEKRQVQATNDMIQFLQQEWKPNQYNPMKNKSAPTTPHGASPKTKRSEQSQNSKSTSGKPAEPVSSGHVKAGTTKQVESGSHDSAGPGSADHLEPASQEHVEPDSGEHVEPPLPKSQPEVSGIVNHITINGEMSGDIGYQKTESPALNRPFPSQNGYPSTSKAKPKTQTRSQELG